MTECIINGVRRKERERFTVKSDRESDLCSAGLLMSERTANALWYRSTGRILSPDAIASTYPAGEPGDRPLRVLQLTHYDPGCAAYRYHSALNTRNGVLSAFIRAYHNNPSCDLRQWDAQEHAAVARMLAYTADVIVCHMDYKVLNNDLRIEVDRTRQLLVRHYHGSIFTGETHKLIEPELDAELGALQMGARPYHHRFGVPHWLPIPMPVYDYAPLRALRAPRDGRPFRVAHSPTVRVKKGTDEFLSAIAELNADGVPIEAVLIENLEHGEALKLKATCDATFDSFFLGMQGSGLEAACMGQAVVAGDPLAMKDLTDLGIPVPWTVATNGPELRFALRQLATEPAYCKAEAEKVRRYTEQFHSYGAVGDKFLSIVGAELARRGLTPTAEPLARAALPA